MFLGSYRFVRLVVLGLMFFLATTAPCSSNSYDPDPYDDTPPVVTVEFNYVVPAGINVRQHGTQSTMRRSVLIDRDALPGLATLPAFAESRTAPDLQQGSPQLLIPLRR